MEILGCSFPENEYRTILDDGRTLVLKIIRTERNKGTKDETKPCGIEEQINSGETNASLMQTKICKRCNTAFNVVGYYITPKNEEESVDS